MNRKRKYTAKEIQRMRAALDELHPTYVNFFGSMMGPGPQGIEQMLRTHMENGTSPEELEAMVGEDA